MKIWSVIYIQNKNYLCVKKKSMRNQKKLKKKNKLNNKMNLQFK